MAEQKDPTQITLREAAQMYRTEIGTKSITRFNAGNSFAEYGDIPLTEAFAGNRGSRLIDEMAAKTGSAGSTNALFDDLRLISKPVAREIKLQNPDSPVIKTLPGAEAADEQTKTIFGERKKTPETVRIAILSQNKEGLKDLFNQLEAIGSDPSNPKAPIADAILVSLYSGPRGGLIAGLQGSEYDPDTASIYVQPQEKASLMEGEEGRVGAQKEGGLRKKAIPYRIPLNEDGQAYMQRQLKRLAADPDIVKFLNAKAKEGKAPIFVYKSETGKVTQVGTKQMSDLLGTIKTVEPIIENKITGKKYNSLNPQELTAAEKKSGKWGEALTRNIHGTIAINEARLDGQLVDFLHSRSETSGKEGTSVTQKLRYAERARGYFFEGEREGSQQIANWFNNMRGRDVTSIPDVETRVSKATYAIPGFLDPPDPAVITPQAQPIPAEKPPPASLNDLSPETRSAMEKAGFKFKSLIVPGTIAAGTAASVITSEDAAAAGSEVVRDVAIDVAGETGLKKVLGRVAAGRIPVADVLIPSGTMANQELTKDDRAIQSQQEMEDLSTQAAQTVEDEDAARIQRVRQQQLMSRPIPGKSFLNTEQQP